MTGPRRDRQSEVELESGSSRESGTAAQLLGSWLVLDQLARRDHSRAVICRAEGSIPARLLGGTEGPFPCGGDLHWRCSSVQLLGGVEVLFPRSGDLHSWAYVPERCSLGVNPCPTRQRKLVAGPTCPKSVLSTSTAVLHGNDERDKGADEPEKAPASLIG